MHQLARAAYCHACSAPSARLEAARLEAVHELMVFHSPAPVLGASKWYQHFENWLWASRAGYAESMPIVPVLPPSIAHAVGGEQQRCSIGNGDVGDGGDDREGGLGRRVVACSTGTGAPPRAQRLVSAGNERRVLGPHGEVRRAACPSEGARSSRGIRGGGSSRKRRDRKRDGKRDGKRTWKRTGKRQEEENGRDRRGEGAKG